MRRERKHAFIFYILYFVLCLIHLSLIKGSLVSITVPSTLQTNKYRQNIISMKKNESLQLLPNFYYYIWEYIGAHYCCIVSLKFRANIFSFAL